MIEFWWDRPGAGFVDPADALAAAAAVASEGDDLAVLLGRLAEVALGPVDAFRASFFLLDEQRSGLHLWASATAGETGPRGFQEGIDMGPVRLDEVRAAALQGEAFAIEDVGATDLIPAEWRARFGAASVIVAPLRFGHDPLGVLVVDWQERRSVPPELVVLIDGIARSSAMAVAHAWASARLHGLLEATRRLASSATLTEAAEVVADALERLLGAKQLSVHLLDETRSAYRVLLQRGLDLPVEGRMADLGEVARVWADPASARPVVRRGLGLGGLNDVIVLPLVGRDADVFGFIVAGLEDGADLRRPTVETAGALAAHVAFAVERAGLVERVGLGAQFANALLELNELDEGHEDGPGGLLAGLRDSVPVALGFRVSGMRLATEAGVVEVGDLAGTDDERALWRRWRRRKTRPRAVESRGSVYAPVWEGGRVVGVLRVQPVGASLADHEHGLLDTLAAAIGDAVGRQRLRRTMERRERALAVAEERARVAWDLHETVAGFLRAIELTAARVVDSTSGRAQDDAWQVASLTRSGRQELEEAVRMAASLSASESIEGVVEALGDLLGAAADLTVRGTPRPLGVETQRLLLRTVFETLCRVERHGRASGVAVRIEYGDDDVAVVVRDDGIDLRSREGPDGDGVPSVHFGLRMVQRRVEEAGGRLTVEHRPPRGLLVRASVPFPKKS